MTHHFKLGRLVSKIYATTWPFHQNSRRPSASKKMCDHILTPFRLSRQVYHTREYDIFKQIAFSFVLDLTFVRERDCPVQTDKSPLHISSG